MGSVTTLTYNENMKILLVDDDAFLRDMYATKFQEAGYEVSTAENGAQAMRLIGEEKFDVALLDMVMPGMSGVELLERIMETTSETKCIVLSNQGEQSDIDTANRAGAIGYIVKAESIPSQVVTKVETLATK